MSRKIIRQTRKTKAPLFVLLSLIIIVVIIIATIFTLFLKDDLNKDNKVQIGKISNTSSQVTSGADSKEASKNSSKEQPKPVQVPINYVRVPKSDQVAVEYFKDAVFIGDSISVGFRNSQALVPQNVIAAQNIGFNQIASDKPVFDVQSKKYTLFDAIKTLGFEPKKIYILLGTNGLPWYDNSAHIEYYETVLDRIKSTYPKSTIYLESVPPITNEAELRYKRDGKTFTNEKINEFNKMVEALAEKKKVFYLNIHEALVNKDGVLSDDYDAKDGVHLMRNGYQAMADYYRTHTVGGVLTPEASE
ncbi:GDSL-type esterase/lipase family protein [Paludicola sp. MB14-C6]|uniref:GDSL-type esterase/lipase family protein n=1 Tax=Paludihabitans sp. MB14-C6 TaxID=3070656 RepID=UPI0027DE4D2B|nr:GDSL-type esterase/lipase family protein [Paludicola sp. MB14-C6]WMJ22592.1 GDSL-type esterase/lipase family protein [Paludicola sp. MB14-C6]